MEPEQGPLIRLQRIDDRLIVPPLFEVAITSLSNPHSSRSAFQGVVRGAAMTKGILPGPRPIVVSDPSGHSSIQLPEGQWTLMPFDIDGRRCLPHEFGTGPTTSQSEFFHLIPARDFRWMRDSKALGQPGRIDIFVQGIAKPVITRELPFGYAPLRFQAPLSEFELRYTNSETMQFESFTF